jgi:hypothetical protein
MEGIPSPSSDSTDVNAPNLPGLAASPYLVYNYV